MTGKLPTSLNEKRKKKCISLSTAWNQDLRHYCNPPSPPLPRCLLHQHLQLSALPSLLLCFPLLTFSYVVAKVAPGDCVRTPSHCYIRTLAQFRSHAQHQPNLHPLGMRYCNWPVCFLTRTEPLTDSLPIKTER